MFKPQAAGKDRPGNTGKKPGPGCMQAEGGSLTFNLGRLSLPAKAGITSAPPRIKPTSTRNYGA
jgi:hypothetical protein